MINNLKLIFGRWSRIIILAIAACLTLWFLLNFSSFLNKAKEFKEGTSLVQNSLPTTSSVPSHPFTTSLPTIEDKLKSKVSVTPLISSREVIEQRVTMTPSMTPTPNYSPTPMPVSPASMDSTGSISSPQTTPTPTTSPASSMSPAPSPLITPTPTITPTHSPTPMPSTLPPSIFKVIINEIAWMGTSALLSSDEWIELYNITNTPVSLDGWILISETDSSPNIVLSGTINAFSFYLIERTDDNTVSDIIADFKGSFGTGGLKNTGEKLILKDENGNVQDMVDGSSGWYAGTASPDYKSMERIDPNKSGNDIANWATNNSIIKNGLDAANNQINGTPRNQNSAY